MVIVLKNKEEIKVDNYLNGAIRFHNKGKEIHIYTLGNDNPEIVQTKDIEYMY